MSLLCGVFDAAEIIMPAFGCAHRKRISPCADVAFYGHEQCLKEEKNNELNKRGVVGEGYGSLNAPIRPPFRLRSARDSYKVKNSCIKGSVALFLHGCF